MLAPIVVRQRMEDVDDAMDSRGIRGAYGFVGNLSRDSASNHGLDDDSKAYRRGSAELSEELIGLRTRQEETEWLQRAKRIGRISKRP